jgi:hypothetical protein
MKTPETNKQNTGWSCLGILLIVAFLMTFGQAIMGASWFWPILFGLGLWVIIRKQRDHR